MEIPDLGKIIATMRAGKPGDSEEGMKLRMSRNPNSPYKTREDVTHSPLISQVIPPSKQAQWMPNAAKPDPAKYYKFLEVRNDLDMEIAKIIADNKLDAIVHKTDEHTPTLLKDGLNPPYYNQLGVTSLNTFLISVALELSRREGGGHMQTHLDRIERETQRLNDLITQLLSLSYMEITQEIRNATSISLSDLVRDVLPNVQYEASLRGCHITAVMGQNCVIRGDARLLESALENILRNALRYTPENGVIEVDLAETESDQQRIAELSVCDRGPGVPAEELEAISADMIGASREKTGATPLLERGPDPGAVKPLPPDKHTAWGQAQVSYDELRPNGVNVVARTALVEEARSLRHGHDGRAHRGGSGGRARHPRRHSVDATAPREARTARATRRRGTLSRTKRCPRAWEAEAVEDGRLAGADGASFERHAATCPTCAHEVEAIASLHRAMREIPPPEVTPLELRRMRVRLLQQAAGADEIRCEFEPSKKPNLAATA